MESGDATECRAEIVLTTSTVGAHRLDIPVSTAYWTVDWICDRLPSSYNCNLKIGERTLRTSRWPAILSILFIGENLEYKVRADWSRSDLILKVLAKLNESLGYQ